MKYFWVLEYKSRHCSVYLMTDTNKACFSIHECGHFPSKEAAEAFKVSANKLGDLDGFVPVEHGVG